MGQDGGSSHARQWVREMTNHARRQRVISNGARSDTSRTTGGEPNELNWLWDA